MMRFNVQVPRRRNLGFFAIIGLVVFGVASARGFGQDSPPLVFEVASVRVNTSGTRMTYPGVSREGRTFRITNAPLAVLILIAYDSAPNLISGIPNSLTSAGFDIDAKTDRVVSNEQMMRMLQNLLTERFNLKLRRETKEMPVYALVVGKDGPKFHESKEAVEPDGQKMGRGKIAFKNTPMSLLAKSLSGQLDRMVLDKTGLSGSYDFTLEYAPERIGQGGREAPSSSTNGPSIFTAVQEQLGLKLESQRGPIEFLIIDHAEKPSEN